MSEKEPAHVRQALNELENTSNEEQQRAARKRLAAAGHRETQARTENDAEDPDGKRDRGPQGRRAPTRQQA